MSRSFQLVDVFGAERFKGNPVAVIASGDGLSTEEMQQITRWLNLSETTFLLPPSSPDADYRVRIFTLDRELPFAGHPTLGTCHAWLQAGGIARRETIVQQCEAGLIPIRRTEDGLAFAAPPLLRSGPVDEADIERTVAILGIERAAVVDANWVDNGPGWLGIMLRSAEEVLALRPQRSWPERADIGIVGPHPAGSAIDWEVRAIFSDQFGGLIEDPITGSLNASLAQWLIGSGRAGPRYRAAQGTAIGRSGRIFVERDDAGEIWIAGNTETLFTGTTGF
ncbi:PhzF family phenazine biosynthesis protein [Sphingomonas colocasiae]|uniref:PhzF family phenazine biosynthesis protein n=1 Tax=Sphingomonas colocasiae TaxID=1848973 RepID=A0ABS7PMH4_9SPHN|nr:PhzF family phenazine biosynthesis protein [Sphingomonas colocasiae]MBY8821249.1 PhzF family phenazine biosynthesis protein [Sphingomonas colocasiae]